MYLRQNGFLPPLGWPQGYGHRFMGQPPQYRPPPPVFDGVHKGPDKNHLMQHIPHMRCYCCGDMQHWSSSPYPHNAPFFTATTGGVPFSSHAPSGTINPGYPNTLFVRASNATGSSAMLPVHLPTSASMIRPDYMSDFNQQQPHMPTVPNTLPPHARNSYGLGMMGPNGRPASACFANRHMFPVPPHMQVNPALQNMDWSVNPMHGMLGHRLPYQGPVPFQGTRILQHKDVDPEDIRYGPFSDGEGDRITRRPQKIRNRRPSFPMSNTIIDGVHSQHIPGMVPPHYVTLTRATSEAIAAGASLKNGPFRKGILEGVHLGNAPFGQPEILGPQDSSNIGNKNGKRYNSQPQLNEKNGVVFDLSQDKNQTGPLGRSSSCGASSNKNRLNDKPELPKYKPILQVKSYKGGTSTTAVSPSMLKKDGNRNDDDYLFPDLPPPPDTLLEPRGGDTVRRGISVSVSNKDNKHASNKPSSFLVHQTSFDFASSDSQMMNDGTQNSRSSSLDDLTLQECPPILPQEPGGNATDIRENFYQKSNTLPINSSIINNQKRTSPNILMYGSEEAHLGQSILQSTTMRK